MGPFRRNRLPFGTLAALTLAALGCCLLGAMISFVVAPQQRAEAGRTAGLATLDGAAFEALPPGEALLLSGTLSSEAPSEREGGLLAFTQAEWQVEEGQLDDEGTGRPRGSWRTGESVVPPLLLTLEGRRIALTPLGRVELGGPLHELIVPGKGRLVATYDGVPLPHGSMRYRGLLDGDVVTVVGVKGRGLQIAPQSLFRGDRAALEASQRASSGNLFRAGLCLMALAPFVLVGGALVLIVRRR